MLPDMSPQSGQALSICLLGRFHVLVDGRPIEPARWRRRKAASLVKLLALLPGHRLHREQVIELLWPELDPDAAANNLHRTLHVARRILEPDLTPARSSRFLRLEGEVLVLAGTPNSSGAVAIDVELFESAASVARRMRTPVAYEAALRLYAGGLLPDDQYEDWVMSRADELRGLYLALLMELSQLYTAHGQAALAIQTLQRLIGDEPAHEAAHVELMRLFVQTGQRHLALRQYQQLREALRQELDVEPDAASIHLYHQIAAGQYQVRQSAEAPVTPSSNLPSQLTSFVGRAREQEEIKELLTRPPTGSRLLTLTGTGGAGKTRLAIQVATNLLAAYPDGVWLVELDPVQEAAHVPQAIGSLLGVREESGKPLVQTIADALRAKQVLLVLDNCEHLLAACATLASALLKSCSHLHILATSREPLGVSGEIVWRVPPLSIPDREQSSTFEDVRMHDAVQLFVERARLVQPRFLLTPENASAVATICRSLDGIPLAVELAAARVKVMSVEQIAARSHNWLGMLTLGSRTAASRQQTLRATIDWSYVLLSDQERTVFNRLAVFAGGWTVDEAEVVCAGAGIEKHQVLDLLTQLVDRSLIAVSEHGRSVRFRLLEPIRQYCAEKLRLSGELTAVRRRHAECYLALAEHAEPELTGDNQGVWLERLEVEHDNLRAALRWAIESGDVTVALRIGAALWRFWYARGYLSEGSQWLHRALVADNTDRASDQVIRANALHAAATLTYAQGDAEQAVQLYDEALVLRRAAGDRRGIAATLNNRGMVAQYLGEHQQAREMFEEALSVSRASGDKRLIAISLINLGTLAKEQDDFTRATALLEEALALFRLLQDDRTIADLLNNLGSLAARQGSTSRAILLCEESLALFRTLVDKPGMVEALLNLGIALRDQGEGSRPVGLFEEALGLSRQIGDKWGAALALNNLALLALERADYGRAALLGEEGLALHRDLEYKQGIATSLRTLARVAQGQGDIARAVERYRESLSISCAIGDQQGIAACTKELAALDERRALRESVLLTRRELEIAALIASGFTNRQIAERLSISDRTADTHVSHILAKLELTSRAQIASWALARHLSPGQSTHG